MIPELREKFNSKFSEKKYQSFLAEINSLLKWPADFRICETPLFLSDDLTKKLNEACKNISAHLQTEEFKSQSFKAIPPDLYVPGESDHPLFLQLDFAITKKNGEYFPKLIELQGFPSLYSYQYFFSKTIRKYFEIPAGYKTYFSGLNAETYIENLRELILGDEDPDNVVLLEITPDRQKTRIDFAATEELFGVKPVCITDVYKKKDKLFYKNSGMETPIKRIYNRVIFDELLRTDMNLKFDLREEINVQWAGHPNWFFRISKHSLPSLTGEFVPECYFLSDLKKYPENLNDFVLKPLYSFAGLGVEVDVTKERLDQVKERSNYILQEKVEYAPLIKTPDGYSKVEIRMMFFWKNKPMLANNLVRTSKGKMMGVDFNKNKTWVGSSAAFHP